MIEGERERETECDEAEGAHKTTGDRGNLEDEPKRMKKQKGALFQYVEMR
jgi:hypothetical protein